MAQNYHRKGPDGLQKLFLYLILIDWFVLFYLVSQITNITFRHGAFVSILLGAFNLLLVGLCFKRARRGGDGYLLYPVIFGALLSFIMVFYFFLFKY